MKYYSIIRPIEPGSVPSGMKAIVNFDEKEFVSKIEKYAWGYVEYEKPLDHPEHYDLIDEDFLKRHVRITRLEKNIFSLESPLLKGKNNVMEKSEALSFIKSHNCTYEFV